MNLKIMFSWSETFRLSCITPQMLLGSRVLKVVFYSLKKNLLKSQHLSLVNLNVIGRRIQMSLIYLLYFTTPTMSRYDGSDTKLYEFNSEFIKA